VKLKLIREYYPGPIPMQVQKLRYTLYKSTYSTVEKGNRNG